MFHFFKTCFFDYSVIKFEINNRKTSGKPLNIWRPNNTFLHNPCGKEEITKEIRAILS